MARATGLSDSAVRAFVNGSTRLPLPGALDAYEEMLADDAGLGGDEPPGSAGEGGDPGSVH